MSGSPIMVTLVAALAIGLSPGLHGTHATTGLSDPAPLVVPTAFPTIQAAIDAAAPGATIQVSAGTYTEQLRITKPLTLIGSGMDATVIRAPATLKRNDEKDGVIVDIVNGASVSMSRLTVAGPGTGTCKKGALSAGIRVRDQAHLDLSYAAVRHVHDARLAACFHSGDAVRVGDVPGPAASLVVHHSEITDYQSAGVVVLGFGSTATVTRNTVTGPGQAGGVATGGIEFPVGAVGTITHNVVSGNICPPADPTCGTDWFTQFQLAGIGAGGWGPGTVVSDNLAFDNQVGLLLGESDEISDNRMVDNDFFGLALFDGTFVVDGGQIKGGGGGVWVIADSSDTSVALNDVSLAGLSGPDVAKVECCGFTASVTSVP